MTFSHLRRPCLLQVLVMNVQQGSVSAGRAGVVGFGVAPRTERTLSVKLLTPGFKILSVSSC